MPKKTKALAVREVEVLGPAREIPDARAAIEQLVEQKIAEMMGSGDAIFEPFFRTKQIADEIKRLETVPMQRKWTRYFEEYGCLICESKEVPHRSLGMCANCHHRTAMRLARILGFTEGKLPMNRKWQPDGARDLQDVAKDALKRR